MVPYIPTVRSWAVDEGLRSKAFGAAVFCRRLTVGRLIYPHCNAGASGAGFGDMKFLDEVHNPSA
jgi:hypothetical protein